MNESPNNADSHAKIYGLRREPHETDEQLQGRVQNFVEARTPEDER